MSGSGSRPSMRVEGHPAVRRIPRQFREDATETLLPQRVAPRHEAGFQQSRVQRYPPCGPDVLQALVGACLVDVQEPDILVASTVVEIELTQLTDPCPGEEAKQRQPIM